VLAGNATEALAALATSTPKIDAILSDIGLPGTDGYALLEAVRDLPGSLGALPIIAVTAYASVADETRARNYGFVAHIAKPYLPSALIAAVRDATGRR
jgi:CheY-like chemotaxis protein